MAPSTTYDDDKHFLMCIILNKEINIQEECKAAAVKMGSKFKAETLRQRFYKLKKEADALLATSAADAPVSTPDARPTSTKKATSAKKSTTKKRKAATSGDVQAEEAEVTETPSKKPKKEKTTEEVDGDGEM